MIVSFIVLVKESFDFGGYEPATLPSGLIEQQITCGASQRSTKPVRFRDSKPHLGTIDKFSWNQLSRQLA